MTDRLKTWEYMYFADSAYGRDQRDGRDTYIRDLGLSVGQDGAPAGWSRLEKESSRNIEQLGGFQRDIYEGTGGRRRRLGSTRELGPE